MVQQLTKTKSRLTHQEVSREDSCIDIKNIQTQETHEESKCFPRNKAVYFMHIKNRISGIHTPTHEHSQIICILDIYLKITIL